MREHAERFDDVLEAEVAEGIPMREADGLVDEGAKLAGRSAEAFWAREHGANGQSLVSAAVKLKIVPAAVSVGEGALADRAARLGDGGQHRGAAGEGAVKSPTHRICRLESKLGRGGEAGAGPRRNDPSGEGLAVGRGGMRGLAHLQDQQARGRQPGPERVAQRAAGHVLVLQLHDHALGVSAAVADDVKDSGLIAVRSRESRCAHGVIGGGAPPGDPLPKRLGLIRRSRGSHDDRATRGFERLAVVSGDQLPGERSQLGRVDDERRGAPFRLCPPEEPPEPGRALAKDVRQGPSERLFLGRHEAVVGREASP